MLYINFHWQDWAEEANNLENTVAQFLLRYMALIQLAREEAHYNGDHDWEAIKLMSRANMDVFKSPLIIRSWQNLESYLNSTKPLQRKVNGRWVKIREEGYPLNMLLVLKTIRNNLFHGNKKFEENRDSEIIKLANDNIRTILRVFL